jgi:hypothetical protein
VYGGWVFFLPYHVFLNILLLVWGIYRVSQAQLKWNSLLFGVKVVIHYPALQLQLFYSNCGVSQVATQNLFVETPCIYCEAIPRMASGHYVASFTQ